MKAPFVKIYLIKILYYTVHSALASRKVVVATGSTDNVTPLWITLHDQLLTVALDL